MFIPLILRGKVSGSGAPGDLKGVVTVTRPRPYSMANFPLSLGLGRGLGSAPWSISHRYTPVGDGSRKASYEDSLLSSLDEVRDLVYCELFLYIIMN